jgi:transposase
VPSEKALKRSQKRVSRNKKGSSNRKKAINRLGRKRLKVSRQRKDFTVKTALNILAKGLKQAGISSNTVGHTGINAWGQTDLYSLVVTSTGKLTD